TSFHAAPPTETCSHSLHDALPILQPYTERFWGNIIGGHGAMSLLRRVSAAVLVAAMFGWLSTLAPHDGELRLTAAQNKAPAAGRSEEHTSELQSREKLVCRLLLEK